jgi:hypothetical protein
MTEILKRGVIMFGKLIFVVVIAGIIVNTSFAVQPQSGKWEANGSGTSGDGTKDTISFKFSVANDQLTLTTDGSVVIAKGKWGEARSAIGFIPMLNTSLTMKITDGSFSYKDNNPQTLFEGTFDSKLKAHGTWKYEFMFFPSSPSRVTSEGTWIASCVEPNVVAKILLGDVNNDGVIRSNDAIIALQIAAGLREPNDYEKIAADVNGDGKIRSNDAIKILQMAVGLGAPEVNSSSNIKKPITLALSDLHGTAGDTVILPLNIDNTNTLAGGDICIAYNNSILQASEVSSSSNALMVSKITDPGVIRIAFAGSGKLNRSTLANVKFKVLSDGISLLKLKDIDLYGFDGNPISSIFTDGEFRSWAVAPERSALLQNYPNPFNPETWIPYQLHESSEVVIRIHNVTGELVRELRLGYKPVGQYTTQDRSAYWDGRNEAGERVSSGVYFYNIQAGNYNATMKMIVKK